MLWPTLLTALAVAALLVGEHRGARLLRGAAKSIASLGFIWAALAAGATASGYGRAVLAALALSLVGDVLLLGRSRPAFLGGLAAFLLGHLAYLAAFALRGLSPRWALAALVAVLAVGVPVGRWLIPRVERGMRGPVVAYMVVLSAMVVLAAGTTGARPAWSILVGAVAFYFSDLAVALDRFVAPGFHNRAWGLPLYYGAQLCLAWSVAQPMARGSS